jgi:hypothetical protein
MQIVFANGLPISRCKSKNLNYPLITGGYVDMKEEQKSMK